MSGYALNAIAGKVVTVPIAVPGSEAGRVCREAASVTLTVRKRLQRILAGLPLLLACACTAAHAQVPEPPSYRLDHYRAPVPATLQGATVLHTPQLAVLIAIRHPILIDVLPVPAPPADARPGMPRMPPPHGDIPGSLWFPEVGRGALSPDVEHWFAARLNAVTHGEKATPIVFYCLSQCWISWNAAKRAVADGYTQVLWYPDGTDGWVKDGHATAVTRPER